MKQVLKNPYECEYVWSRHIQGYFKNNCQLKHFIKKRINRRRRREAKRELRIINETD